jgi:cytochrome c biogenesis protein ResB
MLATTTVEQAQGDGAPAWLARLGSLKLTLVILALFFIGILAYYTHAARSVWMLVAPLALFALNLGGAMLVNPAFRRQTALLVFHLALIAIALLVAAGRLTYLKGQLELSTGETFSGQLSQTESGPWHAWQLDRAGFANEGFSIDYSPGIRRDQTRNAVRWVDAEGRTQRAVVGDQTPLVLEGYRFYTSSNKGFAPLFTWQPANGKPRLGTVHLPAYPVHEYRQALDWVLPESNVKIWTMLQFDEVLLDPARPSQFRLPGRHTLIVRLDEERRELQPGDRYELAQGTLTYQGLTTWMGYTVFYDWTLPWLLAACVLAVSALAWHFWKKFAAHSWEE